MKRRFETNKYLKSPGSFPLGSRFGFCISSAALILVLGGCSSGSSGDGEGDGTSSSGTTIVKANTSSTTSSVITTGTSASVKSPTFGITNPVPHVDPITSLAAKKSFINTTSVLVSWEEPKDVKDYDILVAPTESCTTAPYVVVADYVGQDYQLTDLSEGSYFVCIQAVKSGGILTNASNSPYEIVVDLTAPEAFTISEVVGVEADSENSEEENSEEESSEESDPEPAILINNTPTFEWSESVGADYYQLRLATDSECTTFEFESERLTETSLTMEPIDDGSYFLCIESSDYAGNKTQANNSSIPFTIDTAPPFISSIEITQVDGPYKTGDTFEIIIGLSETFVFTASEQNPVLVLETGEVDGEAIFDSMNDDNKFVFNYTIKEGDETTDLELAELNGGPLDLKGGSIEDAYGNLSSGKLTVSSSTLLSDGREIIIDTGLPTKAANPRFVGDAQTGDHTDYDNDATIYLVWDASKDDETTVSSYDVEFFHTADCSGGSEAFTDIHSDNRYYEFTGATHSKTYSFMVTSYDRAGNANQSDCSSSISIDTIAPTAISSLVTPADSSGGSDANYDDDTDFYISYSAGVDADSGLSHYLLYTYENANCSGEAASTTQIISNDTSYEFAGIDGTTYSFKVSAFDNAGSETASSCSTAMVVDITDPTSPANLTVAADSPTDPATNWDNDSSAYFVWDAGVDTGSGVEFYNLQYFSSSNCTGTPTEVNNLTGSTLYYNITGLTNGSVYTFKLTTIDYAGNSSVSGCSSSLAIDTASPTAATSLITPGDAASGLDADFDNDTSFYLAWTAGTDSESGMGSYTLKTYTQANCSGSATDTTGIAGTATSYNVTGVDGTYYSFKLVSIDNAGNQVTSGCSSNIGIDTTGPVASTSVITPADASGGADVNYDDDTDFYFKWDAASDSMSGLASYTVYHYDAADCGGSETIEAPVSAATLNQSFTGTTGTTYSFKVLATDNIGNTSFSSCSTQMLIDTSDPDSATALFFSRDLVSGPASSYDNDDELFLRWTPGTDAESGISSAQVNFFTTADCTGGSTPIAVGATDATYTRNAATTTGNEFSFQVVTTNNSGRTATSTCSSSIEIDKVVPAAASSLKFAPDATTDADASYDDDLAFYSVWTLGSDADTDIESYTVELYPTNNCTGTATEFSGLANTVTDQAITGTEGTAYSFIVKAIDLAGNETDSACHGSIIPDTLNPTGGSNFRITDTNNTDPHAIFVDDTSIHFSWDVGADTGSGVNEYELEIFTGANCDTSVATPAAISHPTNTYNYATAIHGNTYSFTLKTTDNAGNETQSVCSTVSTLVDTADPVIAGATLETAQDSATGPDASYDDDLTVFFKFSGVSDADSGLETFDLNLFVDDSGCTGAPNSTIDISAPTDTSYEYTGTHGETYSFQIVAADKAGNTITTACSSSIMVDTVAPVASTGELITKTVDGSHDSYINSNTINFEWAQGSDADSGIGALNVHRYDQENCAGTATVSPVAAATDLQHAFASAVHATSYSFKLETVDNAGNSVLSACSSNSLVDTVAPTAPTNLKTAADSSSGPDADYDNDINIIFVWDTGVDDDSGLASYSLNRYDGQSDCSGTPDATTDSINPLTLTQNMASADGQEHAFEIVTYDRAGNESTSVCSSSILVDTTAPVAPSTLKNAPDASTDADANYDDDPNYYFVWDAATDVGGSGIASYNIYRYDQANCLGLPTVTSETVGTLEQAFTGTEGTTYSFKVEAVDNVGWTQLSACSGSMLIDETNPVAATSVITPADSAGGADATYDNDTSFFVAWTAATDTGGSGIESYTLKSYDGLGCTGTMTATTGISGAAISQAVSGATNDDDYSFIVTAIDYAGNEADSICSTNMTIDTDPPTAPTTVTTAPDATTDADADYDDDADVFWVWSGASDAETSIASYSVNRYESADCTGTAATTSSINPTFGDLAFTATEGTTYTFEVVAYDQAGNSATSSCSSSMMVDLTDPVVATSPFWSADSSSGAAATDDNDNTFYGRWTAGSDVHSGIETAEMRVWESTDCTGISEIKTITGTDSYYAYTPTTAIANGDRFSYKIRYVDYALRAVESACSTVMTLDLVDPTGASSLKFAPDAPTDADAAFDTDGSFYVAWAAGSDADSGLTNYSLEVHDGTGCADGTPQTFTPANGVTSQVISGSDGDEFSFRISTNDIAGNSVTSSCKDSLYVDTTAPTAASGLAIVGDATSGSHDNYDNDTTNINFIWGIGSDAHSGLAGHDVEVYTGTACDSLVTTLNKSDSDTFHTYATISHGVNYSFKVTANDNAGNSTTTACSSPILIDTAQPDLTGVTLVTAADASGGADVNYDDDTTVYFNFATPVDADSGLNSLTVNIFDNGTCAGGSPIASPTPAVTDTFYEFTGVNGNTYSFELIATDNAGTGDATKTCSTAMIIDEDAPNAATALNINSANDDTHATYPDSTSIYFEWDNGTDVGPAGIASLDLIRYETSNCSASPAETHSLAGTATSYNYTGGVEGTTYSFILRTIDNAGNQTDSTCSSDATIDTTDPVAPTSLITPADSSAGADATYDNDANFFLAWTAGTDAGSGVKEYTLHTYSQVNCGGSPSDSTVSGAAVNTAITGASNDDDYSFKLTIEDNAGNTTTSLCSTNMTIDTGNPTAAASPITPADDAADADTNYDNDTGVFFKWTAASDSETSIASYTLERYASADCSGSSTDTTGISSGTTDQPYSGLNGGTYTFKVIAYDQAGNSATSACSTPITIDTDDPVAATGLFFSADSNSGASATWDNDNEIHFRWSVPTDSGSGLDTVDLTVYATSNCTGGTSTINVASTSDAYHTDSSTNSHGDIHSFKVVATDLAGNTATSTCSTGLEIDKTNPTGAGTLKLTAASPSGADTSYDTDGTFYAAWVAGSDADAGIGSYDLEVHDGTGCGDGTPQTFSLNSATTSQVVSGSNGNSYSFQITTNDAAGNSVTSACKDSIYVDTAAPTAASSLAIVGDATTGSHENYDDDLTNINFVWAVGSDSDSGLAGHDVEVYTGSACDTFVETINKSNTDTFHTYSSISNGVTYTFKVVANDNAGNSTTTACSSAMMVDNVGPDVTGVTLKTAADASGGTDVNYDDDTTVYFNFATPSDADSGLQSLTLHIYDNGTCAGGSPISSPTPAITDTYYEFTATNNNTYSFELVAVDNAGNSSTKTCSTAMTIDEDAPIAATNLVIGDANDDTHDTYINATSIYFEWDLGSDSGSGIASQTVKRWDVSGCSGSPTATISVSDSATSYNYTSTSHGTTYSIKVTTIDNAGNETDSSCSSDSTIDTTDPVVPTALITPADSAAGADATYDNDANFFLAWTSGSDADSGVASYTMHTYSQVDCGGSPSDTTGIASIAISQAITGASNDDDYSFKLTIIDNAGNSATSACSTDMTIDTAAPTTATSLITPADDAADADASFDDDAGVYFKWTAATDAETSIASYTLHRYAEANCGGTATDTTGINAGFSDQSFTGSDGVTYSFKVTAYDQAGNSVTSACSTNIAIDLTAPTAPATLATAADSAGGVDVNYDDDVEVYFVWSAGSDTTSGIDTYTLHRYDDGTCAGSPNDTTGISNATTSVTYNGTNGNTYSFKVSVIDNVGRSTTSACSTSIQVDTTDPAVASNLITPADSAGGVDASIDNDTTVHFVWDAATDVGGSGINTYTLKRYTQASCAGASTDTTGISSGTTSQTFSSAVHGVTYSFGIIAYDNAGRASSEACSSAITIDTAAPSGFNITGPTNPVYSDLPTVAWENPGDADNYTLIVDDESSCSLPYVASFTGLATTSKALVSNLADGTYYACVEAFDAAGNSTNASNDQYAFEVETTKVHVVYTELNASNYQLIVADLDSGSWSSSTVQSTTTDVIGNMSSIALDSSNNPHVSYMKEVSGTPKIYYSYLNGGSYTAAHNVESSADEMGALNSIALNDSNTASIVYRQFDSTNDFSRFASGTGTSFTPSAIDTVGSENDLKDMAIAMGDEGTNVTHMITTKANGANWELLYRTNATDWASGASEVPDNLNAQCSQYLYATIDVDDNSKPHIAYLCLTTTNACKIFYGEKTGANWSHTEIGTVVSSGCSVGAASENMRPGLILSSTNKAHIVFFDSDNGYIKYRTNQSGSFTGTQTVDNAGTSDGFAFIGLSDDMQAYIVYKDTSGNLKFAHNNTGSFEIDSTSISNTQGIGGIVVEGVAGRSRR